MTFDGLENINKIFQSLNITFIFTIINIALIENDYNNFLANYFSIKKP